MQALFFAFFEKKLFPLHYQQEKTSKKFRFSAYFQLLPPESSVFPHISAVSNGQKTKYGYSVRDRARARSEHKTSLKRTGFKLKPERTTELKVKFRSERTTELKASLRRPDERMPGQTWQLRYRAGSGAHSLTRTATFTDRSLARKPRFGPET